MIYSSDFVFLFVREYKKNSKTEVILVNEEQKVFSSPLYSQTQFKLPELYFWFESRWNVYKCRSAVAEVVTSSVIFLGTSGVYWLDMKQFEDVIFIVILQTKQLIMEILSSLIDHESNR